jgi:hypothetical protein
VIVFSNTTPFIALASIGQLDLLPQLFDKIHVAESVIDDCTEGGRILVPNLRSLDWVIPVADETTSTLPVLFELDSGEKQTIIPCLSGCLPMPLNMGFCKSPSKPPRDSRLALSRRVWRGPPHQRCRDFINFQTHYR